MTSIIFHCGYKELHIYYRIIVDWELFVDYKVEVRDR